MAFCTTPAHVFIFHFSLYFYFEDSTVAQRAHPLEPPRNGPIHVKEGCCPRQGYQGYHQPPRPMKKNKINIKQKMRKDEKRVKTPHPFAKSVFFQKQRTTNTARRSRKPGSVQEIVIKVIICIFIAFYK